MSFEEMSERENEKILGMFLDGREGLPVFRDDEWTGDEE